MKASSNMLRRRSGKLLVGFLCIIFMAGCCTTQDIRDFRKAEQKIIKLERTIREQNLALEKCQDQKDLLEMGKYKTAQDSLPNELIFR